jgi:hypothetical protein
MKIKPPPWFLEAMKITQTNHRRTQGDLHIVFDDDFAPSYSIADTESPEIFNSRTRPAFYNDHVDDSLELAISAACNLGLPHIFYAFPLEFAHLDEAAHAECMSKAGDIAESLVEGSPEWLAVVCYINWVQACFMNSQRCPPVIIADFMVRAGATARELELALLNRDHAERGRKIIRAASEGGKSRGKDLKPQTRVVLAEMSRLLKERPSLSAQRAAELASKNKIGTSAQANRAIWQRNKVKDK